MLSVKLSFVLLTHCIKILEMEILFPLAGNCIWHRYGMTKVSKLMHIFSILLKNVARRL